MAYAYALEFQANGLRISPAQKVLIEGESGIVLSFFARAFSDIFTPNQTACLLWLT